MKKSLFFVALGAIALTSCKKDDSIVAPEVNTQQQGELISLQMGNPLSIETVTRSTGAVGDTVRESDNQNVWMGEKLRVFMLETGNLKPAKESYRVESTDKYGTVTQTPADKDQTDSLFYNTEVTAPYGQTAGDADYGYANKYYPATGTYDFFAYHADDAVKSKPAENEGKTALTVNVTINGSQDLMVAKAALTDEQLEKAEDNGDVLVEEDEDGNDLNMYYSAYAARRDIQPNFKFNHLLSRFVFNVTPGQEEATGKKGIRIDTIYVTGVKNEATMTVASTEDIYTDDIDVTDFLTWGTTSTKNMYLQQRGEDRVMEELEPAYLQWVDGKAVKQTIGESLLLPAGETSYNLVIAYSERPNYVDDYTENAAYKAAYDSAKHEAYDAAKQEAYEVAWVAAQDTARAAEKAREFAEAKRAAYDAAYETAKAAAKATAYRTAKFNAYNAAHDVDLDDETATELDAWVWLENNVEQTVATWTWPDEGAFTYTAYEDWTWNDSNGQEVTVATWTWPLEQSWENNWIWKDQNGVELTAENMPWIEYANWTWDGQAAWIAGYEAYMNRVYKSWVKAELRLADDDSKPFKAGSQYNVNFKVWNMEKIELTMELTGWRSEADLNFDNDSPFVPIVVDYEQIAGDIDGSTDGFTE